MGRREVVDGTPVVRCEAWPDPYYNGTVMYQIRSDKEWGRGTFRLTEESGIHVRYRTRRDSPKGQVCFCARTLLSKCSDTGMLEYNGGFQASPDGAWRWLHIQPPPVHARQQAYARVRLPMDRVSGYF